VLQRTPPRRRRGSTTPTCPLRLARDGALSREKSCRPGNSPVHKDLQPGSCRPTANGPRRSSRCGAVYNTNLIRSRTSQGVQDLLDPKWKGSSASRRRTETGSPRGRRMGGGEKGSVSSRPRRADGISRVPDTRCSHHGDAGECPSPPYTTTARAGEEKGAPIDWSRSARRGPAPTRSVSARRARTRTRPCFLRNMLGEGSKYR